MEATVLPSFTRIGYALRSRFDDWELLQGDALVGRTVVVTGATSGLGFETAVRCARLGATVIVCGRNPDKTAQRRDAIAEQAGSELVETAIADLGELDEVRRMASDLLERHPTIDALVHNAGALTEERRVTSAGFEATIAGQVLGPFLLTNLLLDALRRAPLGRVITVASGGMYTAGLDVADLQMSSDEYKGTKQYALAKRAQVTLNELWAEHVSTDDIVFHAMHPGWADTPGVEASLPTFRKIVGPLLRSPAQGADTIVWLVAADAPTECSGEFWLDRAPRSIHKQQRTRTSDTAAERAALWAWCISNSGISNSGIEA